MRKKLLDLYYPIKVDSGRFPKVILCKFKGHTEMLRITDVGRETLEEYTPEYYEYSATCTKCGRKRYAVYKYPE